MRLITDPKALTITAAGPQKWKVRLKGKCTRRDKMIDIRRVATGTREDAEIMAQSLIHGDESKQVVAERHTVATYAKSWLLLNTPRWQPKTAERNAARMDVWFNHTDLGSYYLDSLDADDVHEGCNVLAAAGYKPWHYLVTLRAMLKKAGKKAGYHGEDIKTFIPEEIANLKATLTGEELDRVLQQMKGRFKIMASIMAFTGLRFCHVAPLRWGDIKLNEGVITPVLSLSGRTVAEISRRKKAPERVPVGPLVPLLREWFDSSPGLPNAPVFLNSREGYTWVSSLRKALRTAVAAAGVDKSISPHCLRYSFNTIALQHGSETAVRALMGHASASMTAHYNHPEDRQHAELQRRVYEAVVGSGQDLGQLE